MPKFVVLSICILYLAFHVQSIQRTNHSVSTDQVINSLLVVYQNLTSAQQRKVDKIIESTADGTDDEQSLTGKINSFVDGLHKSVQDKIDDAKEKFEDVQEDVSDQVTNLKTKANGVINQVHSTIANASQSVQDKYNEIKNKIVGKSDSNATTTTKAPNPPANQEGNNLTEGQDPYPLTAEMEKSVIGS